MLILGVVDDVVIVLMLVKCMLDVGFIIVCNVGVLGYVDVVLCNVIDCGLIFGLCMLVVMVLIGFIGGYVDDDIGFLLDISFVGFSGVVDGVDVVCVCVCEDVKCGVDVIKFMVSVGVFSNEILVGVL